MTVKLTTTAVQKIRVLGSFVPHKMLAKEFGVSFQSVSLAYERKSFSFVDDMPEAEAEELRKQYSGVKSERKDRKLTAQQVREIRALNGFIAQHWIAQIYNVSKLNIYFILKGKSYKWVMGELAKDEFIELKKRVVVDLVKKFGKEKIGVMK